MVDILGENRKRLYNHLVLQFFFSETEERVVLDVGYSGLISYKMTLDENTPNTIEALRIHPNKSKLFGINPPVLILSRASMRKRVLGLSILL